MDRNIKIAKELVRLAKNLVALDEEGDGSGFQYLHDVNTNEWEELDRAEKEGKKYILYKKIGPFWRIRACKNFGDVKKGDLGGLIKSENNLSQDGNCWIGYLSRIAGNAKIYDNAVVQGNCRIYGNAKIYDNAVVLGQTNIYDNAEIYGNARIETLTNEHVQIYDNAKVYGKAWICAQNNDIQISGQAKVNYAVESKQPDEIISIN